MFLRVLGKIGYKKGGLQYVVSEVSWWENPEIFKLIKKEMIEVHGRYEKFGALKQDEVIEYFNSRPDTSKDGK